MMPIPGIHIRGGLGCWLLLALLLSGGEGLEATAASPLGEQVAALAARALAGTWVAPVPGGRLTLQLHEDGRFSLDGRQGTYTLHEGNLQLRFATAEVTYRFELSGQVLKLTGGDLPQPVSFVRQPRLATYWKGLSARSVVALGTKLYRLLTLAAIVLLSVWVLRGLRALSRWLIFSDWGPLRYFYRQHKQRAMTLHAIVLNLCKYFVYFVAIGFALSELGVNYTTYLASLSVLGLAIGFGSQGLVQDMVTGFFILFEGQFAVGDLVEIAGQTGIVEDLGLRMTRLRNYLGQTVVIPNRSIAVVGTYTLGAQQAYVDVAMRSAEAAAQAAPLLQQVATEVARQFAGVVLQPPRVLEPLVLETGERFLRLHLGIWPQQPWVVEQQLVPRLREACQRAGIEIPGDRVVVFYRPREARPVLPWSRSPRAAGATERASPRPAPETPQA